MFVQQLFQADNKGEWWIPPNHSHTMVPSPWSWFNIATKDTDTTHTLMQYIPKIIHTHDDVIKRKHFPRYWPFVRGIHRSPVDSPHKGQWRGALMFSLICVWTCWTNGWANNRDAGNLRRHRAHYDVTAMVSVLLCLACMSILPISLKVTSLALGWSCDCPSVSEATLKNMG